jgi:hypothetical protein
MVMARLLPNMVKLMRFRTIKWLLSMWRAYRFYHSKERLFSSRTKFMHDMRPKLNGNFITWPDAIFWVEPEDVSRAIKCADKSRK